MSRLRNCMLLVAMGAAFWTAACGEFHLSTSNLDLGPRPAFPGDTVVLSFRLNLIPTQRHTIIVHIDDEVHMRVSSTDAPAIPVVLPIGDAADLITRYGAGDHVLQIAVEAHDSGEVTRTRSVILELRTNTN